jgi:hypothetical protein
MKRVGTQLRVSRPKRAQTNVRTTMRACLKLIVDGCKTIAKCAGHGREGCFFEGQAFDAL